MTPCKSIKVGLNTCLILVEKGKEKTHTHTHTQILKTLSLQLANPIQSSPPVVESCCSQKGCNYSDKAFHWKSEWSPRWKGVVLCRATVITPVCILVIRPPLHLLFFFYLFFFISPRMTVLNLSLWLPLIRNSRKTSEFLRCFHLPLFFSSTPAICSPLWPFTRVLTSIFFPSSIVLFGYLFLFFLLILAFPPHWSSSCCWSNRSAHRLTSPFFLFYRVCRRTRQLTHVNARLLCSPLICAWAWASGLADSQGRICLHSNNYFVSAWANPFLTLCFIAFLTFFFTRRCVCKVCVGAAA